AHIGAVAELAWFPADADALTLTDHLVGLASRHLESAGATVRLGSPPHDQRAGRAMDWRTLSLYLPQDLLIAALSAGNGELDPASDHVDLLDPLLARTLSAPVAETHLHVGAALDFGELWQAIFHWLAWDTGKPGEFDEADDGLHGGERHLRLLCSAA